MRTRVAAALVTVLSLAAAAGEARADGDADDFKTSCANCHTIGGGRLVGPDLKDVEKRKDRAWLVGFVTDPTGVLASGDPYAQKLLAEANRVPMTPIAGMNAKRAGQLLDLVAAESKLEKSRFAGGAVPDRAFDAKNVPVGRDLYTGAAGLKGDGPACIGCHRVGDTGALGGGRLAPDLTDAVARLGGRKALSAWLSAPPTPTMKRLFPFEKALDPEREILPLVDFLQDAAARHAPSERAPARVAFVLLALGLAGALLVGMEIAWRRRFRGVRETLVKEPS
ncbi:MAG: c-type cytochrome [Planctomycetes bacterium]|nr:c-type cytochrome [Planctomycetota bacterium]